MIMTMSLKTKIIKSLEEWRDWAAELEAIDMSDAGHIISPDEGLIDGVRDCALITKQHAYSLNAMVKWFKKMIEQRNMPETLGRSDELTTGYCDELLKDLRDE